MTRRLSATQTTLFTGSLLALALINGCGKKTQTQDSSVEAVQTQEVQTSPTEMKLADEGAVSQSPAEQSGAVADSVAGKNAALPHVAVGGQSTEAPEAKGSSSREVGTAETQKEELSCLTFSYRHIAAAGHSPGPDCVHHKNRVELPEAFQNPTMELNKMCVRVDGVPVAFLREGKRIFLAGTPRSRSVISLKACPKGTQCTDDCKIPRDDLLDEIAGGSEGSADGWDADSAKKVTSALSEEIRRELASLDDEQVNSDWVREDAATKTKIQACSSGSKKLKMSQTTNN